MILQSRAIWASKGNLIADGAVRIRGERIAEVGARGDMAPEAGEPVVDLGDSIIFPAFVNAHCHLDYSGLAGELSPGTSFADWLDQIVSIKQSLTHDDYEAAWLAGADMLLSTGCGTVANIESVPGMYASMAPQTPLQVCPFIELIAYHSEDETDAIELAQSELVANKPLALRVGVSPHAPYTMTPEGLNALAMFADEHLLPMSIHLAESNDEWDMFAHGAGPLYDTMSSLGRVMDDCGKGTPVQHLAKAAGFSKHTLAVHANRLIDADVEMLQRVGANVVHCPRSHAWFRHANFDYNRLAKAGVNICLGTDSLASTGGETAVTGLSVFSEMQEFSRNYPQLSCEDLLQMATVNGAVALGLGNEVGVLKEGFIANMAVIPYSDIVSNVPEAIVQHDCPVGMLMIEGKRVFSRIDSIVD
ncbi:uncharacterized protein METZ01_LOCUS246258 [marine metagenome]|uniref:Amidohydrolase-related domain-containing protein n=1 Tax=marine metagenome TaxID=408172 RepID=A0A382I159_9ZZZZ